MDPTPPNDAAQAPAVPPPPPPTAAAPFGAPPASGDLPIGAPPLPQAQPHRMRRRQGLAVSGSGVLVVASIVIRVFLFSGHGSESAVATQYRNAVKNFISKEDGFAPALANAGVAVDLATLKAGALRDFDTAVGALAVPDSAKSDRNALITADHAYESDLDTLAAGGDTVDLASAQQGHIDAANRLAHDLGMGDILTLSSSASSTGG